MSNTLSTDGELDALQSLPKRVTNPGATGRKDEQDRSGHSVQAPPLFIQEKLHPKVLIDDLMRRTDAGRERQEQLDLFGDFNGLEGDEVAKTEFYQHDVRALTDEVLGDSNFVAEILFKKTGS